ncbi:hypothetical protein HDU92_003917 [Lobulomyces angularis]|nr:hypothetical protein HDU92_003917 [Lobulomyces angularis]
MKSRTLLFLLVFVGSTFAIELDIGVAKVGLLEPTTPTSAPAANPSVSIAEPQKIPTKQPQSNISNTVPSGASPSSTNQISTNPQNPSPQVVPQVNTPTASSTSGQSDNAVVSGSPSSSANSNPVVFSPSNNLDFSTTNSNSIKSPLSNVDENFGNNNAGGSTAKPPLTSDDNGDENKGDDKTTQHSTTQSKVDGSKQRDAEKDLDVSAMVGNKERKPSVNPLIAPWEVETGLCRDNF